MNTALRIASVTHVLKDLLNDGLINRDVSGVTSGNVRVTALPPDRLDTTASGEQGGLNLFLYLVRPNSGWRHEGLPGFNQQGQRISNPPLALDLHYFLTAYSKEELHAEILLGYGMQLLHETPALSREAIRRSLADPNLVNSTSLPAALRALTTSDLAEQVEQIKISPESLNAEEIGRLWTAFQAKYRLTAAYKITVVLIQSERPTHSALPVQRRQVVAKPFRQPVIDVVRSQPPGASEPPTQYQKIRVGSKVVVVGRHLLDDNVQLTIDNESIALDSVSESEISFTVPTTLASGIHGMQIIHQHAFGDPPTLHRGNTSNLEAFVLCPTITGVIVYNAGAKTLTVPVNPAIKATQRVVVLLNEDTSTNPKAYQFSAPDNQPGAPDSTIAKIPVVGINAGTYLVRIQVDGAESPLTITNGAYQSPNVTIP